MLAEDIGHLIFLLSRCSSRTAISHCSGVMPTDASSADFCGVERFKLSSLVPKRNWKFERREPFDFVILNLLRGCGARGSDHDVEHRHADYIKRDGFAHVIRIAVN